MTKVDTFAFGGIGFALAISKGETDYRIILSSPSAAADFERVFALGNPQAKAYALVGLRQTNAKRFTELATSLQASTTAVRFGRGCDIYELPLSEIVKRIRSGMYSGPSTRDLIPPPGSPWER